jgi:DNA-binding NarL/FixJ family response regulator
MTPYGIILIDDHNILREGLKRIIMEREDLQVVGEASNPLELFELLRNTTPQMLILDISMPNMRGVEATREVKSISPQTKVLILTMHKDKDYLYHAIEAGADGYLLKEDADSEIFTAIDTIRRGGTYVSPLLAGELTSDWFKFCRGELKQSSDSLTTREREVLKLVAEGKQSKDIAALLFISVRTVDHHRASIMSKLNINNTAELVKYAISKGYVTI